MPFELVKPGTQIDFISRWRIAVAVSVALLVVGFGLALAGRMQFGLDFSPGTEMLVQFDETQTVAEEQVRGAVEALGVTSPAVIRYGDLGENEFSIRFKEFPTDFGGQQAEQVDALKAGLEQGIGPLTLLRAEVVGPKVGAELRRDGLSALGIAILLILVYIAFRFSTRFAPGAVVALVHDVLITSSLLILLGIEFDLQVLAALLAIIGYSLNDTIIVYDRIRENMEARTKAHLPEVINLSINQTLSRTLITSGTTMAAVLALLILGGEVIRPFALSMAIGIVVGTYSSVYIAAPVLLMLEQGIRDEAATAREKREKAKGGKAKAARA